MQTSFENDLKTTKEKCFIVNEKYVRAVFRKIRSDTNFKPMLVETAFLLGFTFAQEQCSHYECKKRRALISLNSITNIFAKEVYRRFLILKYWLIDLGKKPQLKNVQRTSEGVISVKE